MKKRTVGRPQNEEAERNIELTTNDDGTISVSTEPIRDEQPRRDTFNFNAF